MLEFFNLTTTFKQKSIYYLRVFLRFVSCTSSVVQLLRVTKQLPTTKDEYDFYQSYPSFMAFSKNQGQRLLQLIAKVSFLMCILNNQLIGGSPLSFKS